MRRLSANALQRLYAKQRKLMKRRVKPKSLEEKQKKLRRPGWRKNGKLRRPGWRKNEKLRRPDRPSGNALQKKKG